MPQEQIRVFPFFTFLCSVLLFPPTSPADLNSGSTKKSDLILKFCFHLRGVRKDISERDTGNLETMNRFRQCFLLPLQISASLIKTKTRKKKWTHHSLSTSLQTTTLTAAQTMITAASPTAHTHRFCPLLDIGRNTLKVRIVSLYSVSICW